MIIDCISDLHGLKPTLQGGDLLIIAGDLTARDTEKELLEFEDWAHAQDYRKTIVIAGNHDNCLQKKGYLHHMSLDYLCDSGTEFQGLKIWGSPWSVWFPEVNPHCKAFMANEEKLADKYALIPDDVDILITHTPPKNILDGVPEYNCGSATIVNYFGSTSLYDRLCDIRPRLHVFGHIHEQGGKQKILKNCCGNKRDIICVNASLMGPTYKADNDPVRIIL